MSDAMIQTAYYHCDIGSITIQENDSGIFSVSFTENLGLENSPEISDNLKACLSQLEEYFAGDRQEFELKLHPEGTEFQKKVWMELSDIPFGKTVSYLDISKALGDVNFTRAVGNANGKNPIAIIVPCHRVIGHDGSLTGYAGGLHRKEFLLKHETNVLHGKQTKLILT